MTTVVKLTPLHSVLKTATPCCSPVQTVLVPLLFGPVVPVSATDNKLPSSHPWALLVARFLPSASTSSQVEVPEIGCPQSPLTLPPVCLIPLVTNLLFLLSPFFSRHSLCYNFKQLSDSIVLVFGTGQTINCLQLFTLVPGSI